MAAQRYYQGLALSRLQQHDKALPLFQDLVSQAEQALQSPVQLDPDTSFEVQQAARTRMATAHFIAGLGYLGQNDSQKAKEAFTRTLDSCPDHSRLLLTALCQELGELERFCAQLLA